MATLDSLIVIAAALAMAMSPLALGAWLTARGGKGGTPRWPSGGSETER